MIEVEIWQLVGLLLSFFGFLFGAGKILLAQIDKRLDLRFSALEAAGGEWRRLERDWLEFKADMPIQYVRREDYVRGQSIIEAKLDALALKFENVQLRRRAGDPTP
ncbi:membrane protein [Alphaproteobacteria bacterium]|nr:membrane protein [Alphaproteobacteria bacterium]